MTISESKVPSWVSQLESPPAAKSKIPGIVDPVGFGGPSGNKVRAIGRCFRIGRH